MNTLATNQSFEERMFAQMKNQMGELLTVEELKAILERAIDKAFFSPRKDSSGYQSRDREPLFVELIRNELRPLIEVAAKQWAAENQEKVAEILQKQLGDDAAQFVANAFSTIMREPMQVFAFELQNKLSAQGINT